MSHPRYECSECGVRGVRLWREYGVFAREVSPLCASCVQQDQKEALVQDQCGSFVPAVPTHEVDTPWWGYLAIPREWYGWWLGLPLA